MGLLNDLFPGVDPPRKRDAAFEDVIRSCARDAKLTAEDDFVLRVVQLSELLAIRHCVFLMGPTGSGRTECYRVGLGFAVVVLGPRIGINEVSERETGIVPMGCNCHMHAIG